MRIFDQQGKASHYYKGPKSSFDFKFPNITSVIDMHCHAHNVDFEEETHQLPSGKIWKSKCQQCTVVDKEKEAKLSTKLHYEECQEVIKKHNQERNSDPIFKSEGVKWKKV